MVRRMVGSRGTYGAAASAVATVALDWGADRGC